jgi:hypothetical protein
MTTVNNREELFPILVSRVVENAPVKELLRVYGEAVTAAIQNLDDDQLVQAMENAGFSDLIAAFTDIEIEEAES